MKLRQVYLTIIALTLLVSVCFVPLVTNESPSATAQTTNLISPLQTQEPENISISLLTPTNAATIDDDFNISFTFEPKINGTENKFYGADLMINGSIAASNNTALKPYESNTIYYKFSENSTCTWNIGLRNSTNTVYAPDDYSLIVELPSSIGVTVTLKTPDNGTKITDDFNCSFVYVPTVIGEDIFYGAMLVINGVAVASNQTDIKADEDNTIAYNFNSNGTYNWNIRLYNTSTNYVLAEDNYNFTIAVYVAPTATPTPTPTATPTSAPTATPTQAPTPTSTPTANNDLLTTLTIVIIIVIVISGVLVAVLILLRRRQPQT